MAIFDSGFQQVVIAGFIAFGTSGIFNAITGLGNAGSDDNKTAAFANFLVYGFLGIFGYFGGFFFKALGPKLLMAFGASTYVFYTVCVYLSGTSGQWATSLFLFSGALLGFGAALFWTAQGAVTLAYAPKEKKGMYISIFWVIFNMGSLFGGMLTFGLNFHSETDSVNSVSYFVFVAVQGLAVVTAAVFILPTSQVKKTDGSPMKVAEFKSASEELKGAASVIMDRKMALLFVLFFSSNFFYTYVFNTINAGFFNTRTRGFMSGLFYGFQMLGSVVLAKIVDKTGQSVFTRGRNGFFLVLLINTIAWCLGAYIQFGFRGGFVRTSDIDVKLDLLDSGGAITGPILLMILYGLGDSLIQTYSYWVMGISAGDDVTLASRYTGYYKGVQSIGAAIAFLLDSQYVLMTGSAQFVLCVCIFYIGIVLTWFVVRGLPSSIPSESTDPNHGELEKCDETTKPQPEASTSGELEKC